MPLTATRKVRIAALPEMRMAYFELELPIERVPHDDLPPEFGELWNEFNEWRVQARPSLGRIDIAAVGWQSEETEGTVTYRVGVPIRSDYRPPAPAHTMFFPGGAFAYCYADDVDEVPEAFRAVAEHLESEGIRPTGGPMEVYRYHYNLEQHPCDCGVLVDVELQHGGGHDSPLPIGR